MSRVIVTLLLIAAAMSLGPGHTMAGPALVFNPENKMVVYAEDPDMLWHPASLTKLMTAYLTFEAIKEGKLKLNSQITASANANKQPPSKIGLPVGGKMSVDLALRTLIVKSANDVAVMLAEAVSGSEKAFVKKMNATAKRLGMSKTRFYNPNGLPDARQVTTARGLAYLTQAIIDEYPEHAHLFTLTSVQVGKRSLRSHNDLLRKFEGTDGMKTGFICASGFNVVASATREGRRLVAVVLGARTSTARRLRASGLLDYGFENYLWKSLFENHSLETLPQEPEVQTGPKNMRKLMRAWSCGNRPKRAVKKKRRLKPKRKTVKKSNKK